MSNSSNAEAFKDGMKQEYNRVCHSSYLGAIELMEGRRWTSRGTFFRSPEAGRKHPRSVEPSMFISLWPPTAG